MNSKLIKGSLAGVAVVALAVGSTTFAAWSDFAEVRGNNSGAGTLSLNIDDSEVFDDVTLEPGGNGQNNTGDSNPNSFETVRFIASNDGDSVPNGDLFISLTDLADNEDTCNSNSEANEEGVPEDDAAVGNYDADTACGGPGEFSKTATMDIELFETNDPAACDTGGAFNGDRARNVPLDELADYGKIYVAELAPGQGACMKMRLNLPGKTIPTRNDASFIKEGGNETFYGEVPAATNNVQGDSVDFTIRYDLEQVS